MAINYIEQYSNSAIPSLFIKKRKDGDTKVHKGAAGVITPPVEAPEYSLERRLREIDEINEAARKDIFTHNYNGKQYHDSEKNHNTFLTVCGSVLAALGLFFLIGKKKA